MRVRVSNAGYPIFFVSLYELEDCPTCDADGVHYATRTDIAKAAVKHSSVVLNFTNANDYTLVKMKFEGQTGFAFDNGSADFAYPEVADLIARIRAKGAK
jgi:hypothetical protein